MSVLIFYIPYIASISVKYLHNRNKKRSIYPIIFTDNTLKAHFINNR